MVINLAIVDLESKKLISACASIYILYILYICIISIYSFLEGEREGKKALD